MCRKNVAKVCSAYEQTINMILGEQQLPHDFHGRSEGSLADDTLVCAMPDCGVASGPHQVCTLLT